MAAIKWQNAVASAVCKFISLLNGVESINLAMTVTRSTAWKRTRQSECWKNSCRIFQNASLPTGKVMQCSSIGTLTWEMLEFSALQSSHKLWMRLLRYCKIGLKIIKAYFLISKFS